MRKFTIKSLVRSCRTQFARAGRAAVMALLVAAQIAMAVAATQAALEPLDPCFEECESAALLPVNELALQALATRREPLVSGAAHFCGQLCAAGCRRATALRPAASAGGHRLPNGLCAPLRC